MLTADTDLQSTATLPTLFNAHLNKDTYTILIETLEGVFLKNAFFDVVRKESTSIVSAKPIGHLGQIVGPKGEEVGFLGDLISNDGGSRNLNHGAYQILKGSSGFCHDCIRLSDADLFHQLQLFDGAN